MDVFPDLATLSDDDLDRMIAELEAEENEISYKRRLLHGKLDILRAEKIARTKGKGEKTLADEVDVDRLSEILSGKAPPDRSTPPSAA
ncbi:MAG TPA: hypothetical protein VFR32_01520 [Gaiellaceae bacterium]|nr:hypothetical protein [Gaiellaceae bacterium]